MGRDVPVRDLPVSSPEIRSVENQVNSAFLAIVGHQIIFQGMFVAKNLYLRKKLGVSVRGQNSEATLAIACFVLIITTALVQAFGMTVAGVPLFVGSLLMLLSLVVAAASLYDLGDSWRVGVIEEQSTQLVQTGVYRFSRNPYFLAYLLLFAAYTVLLQSYLLLAMSVLAFVLIHRMVLREEQYLEALHGERYRQYRERVPRYLFL